MSVVWPLFFNGFKTSDKNAFRYFNVRASAKREDDLYGLIVYQTMEERLKENESLWINHQIAYIEVCYTIWTITKSYFWI